MSGEHAEFWEAHVTAVGAVASRHFFFSCLVSAFTFSFDVGACGGESPDIERAISVAVSLAQGTYPRVSVTQNLSLSVHESRHVCRFPFVSRR